MRGKPKFGCKRKKSGYPLFLNGSTFYKSFQISQKFGFFSSFSNFSNLSFFNSFSHSQFHNSKNKISFDFQNLHVQYQGTSFKNQPFLISWKKKKENKPKVFKTSFFSNTCILFVILIWNYLNITNRRKYFKI